MNSRKKIYWPFITFLLMLIFFPVNGVPEDLSPCDLALMDCFCESGGAWIWQFACILGWTWCVTYAEPFAR
jgi:hypothetical protein